MKKAGSPPCPKSLILLVEQRGVEPLTSALRTRRSAKLSYCPTWSVILGSGMIGVKLRLVFRTLGRTTHDHYLRTTSLYRPTAADNRSRTLKRIFEFAHVLAAALRHVGSAAAAT